MDLTQNTWKAHVVMLLICLPLTVAISFLMFAIFGVPLKRVFIPAIELWIVQTILTPLFKRALSQESAAKLRGITLGCGIYTWTASVGYVVYLFRFGVMDRGAMLEYILLFSVGYSLFYPLAALLHKRLGTFN